MSRDDYKTATFAAGCFWGVEEAFRTVSGIIETEAGYTGGMIRNPSYEQVCSGRTGHAEAVRMKYDPDRISYDKLLEIFWKIHDPTQVDRQGLDIGSQYRSVIFYHDISQRQEAEKSRQNVADSGRFNAPVVTSIEEAGPFYRAEEYHQKYVLKTGRKVC